MNGSIFFTSFGAMYWVGSKSRTSPAMRVGKVLASKCVTGPMPLLPSTMFFHAVATSLPTGLTMPRPVMTTLRLLISNTHFNSEVRKRKLRPGAQLRMELGAGKSSLDVRLDVIDG